MKTKRKAALDRGGNGQDFGKTANTDSDYTTSARTPQITPKQVSFLSILINRHGKTAYQDGKARLGFPEKTIMRLSRRQAAQLIENLVNRGKGNTP